ncbi:MAG: DNA topoisomerase I [Nanoarchaeota archaeon]
MAYELIITEKPNAAKKIAEALATGKPIKENINKVPIYKITHGKKDIVVGCAVGHLFTVAEKEKSFKYPSYDLEWKPTSEVSKGSEFSKKYLDVLKKISKDADQFTVACDYDIEGEVIGLNVIRYACKQKDARRMKFSTLLKEDIENAYAHVSSHLDWGQALAGETRHFLDWMYGINLSRALMIAVKKAGLFKILSMGRVQGPALKIIVDRELGIRAFIPVPFWQLQLITEKDAKTIEAFHAEDKFWDKEKAQKIFEKCTGKPAIASKIEAKEFNQRPPFPFDLGALQTESFKLFGISPKETLSIAQNLYLGGFTSYPRTSSQQYPKELNFKKILQELQKQPGFKPMTEFLLKKTSLHPHSGPKTDPAHPAIYPTGLAPKALHERDQKVYDLIVKRFFAVFGEDAVRETVSLEIDVAKEPFIARGTRTVKRGWHVLYDPYVKLKEDELPKVIVGEELKVLALNNLFKETQPPKRFTQASIINELEKRGLGTKATRADIVDALYKRGYVKEKAIEATELGIKTLEIIERHVPEIVDEQLTRSFEEEMEKIREQELEPQKVLDHAKTELTKILKKFKTEEAAIGKELFDSEIESQNIINTLGKCPNCAEGMLKVIYSKKTRKRFIACDKYPDCKTTYQLPQSGMVKGIDKICPKCNLPIIHIQRKRGGPQHICINPDCPDKEHNDPGAHKEIRRVEKELLDRKCPKCGSQLVIRTSLYGKFIGCSSFPKCRHIEKMNFTASEEK